MTGFTSARRHVSRLRSFVRRAVVPSCSALLLGCGASRVPAAFRGYDILIQEQDSQSLELARAMREYGYRVRQRIRGGSRPTAALIYFTYSEPGAAQPAWLYVRLADTRSGRIIGSGGVALDSLAPTVRARARAAVQSIAP